MSFKQFWAMEVSVNSNRYTKFIMEIAKGAYNAGVQDALDCVDEAGPEDESQDRFAARVEENIEKLFGEDNKEEE